MKCIICGKVNIRKIRQIKGVEIVECVDCSLGFIGKKKDQKIARNNLYDPRGYISQEGKLRRRFEMMSEKIQEYKKSGTVLDVGAGLGLLSSILGEKGSFVLHLIEPTQKIRYINTPHVLYNTTFEEFKGKKQFYDVILMIDVLEHFRDPLQNLKRIRSLLKKDGILVIQTPNHKSLMAKLCKNWAWWMVEDHKFFFSPRSISLLSRKIGFKMNFFMTYEDWHDFKKNLDGNFEAIKNKFIRKTSKLVFFLLFFPTYLLLRALLWRLKLGGLIVTFLQKE